MTKTPRSPQAEQLADAILRAAGSGLRHYTMHSIRETILDAAQKGIDAAVSKTEHLKVECHPFDSDINTVSKASDAETDPCLISFLEWMDDRHIKAVRHPTGPEMFKDRHIEAMFEGFVCAWGFSERKLAIQVVSTDDVRILWETISLFRSVIQSGERWTATCDDHHMRACKVLNDIESRLAKDCA